MIFFIIWLLCGVITGSIAYSKNRFWLGWFILGCIIGIFGVIWIACLPELEPLEPREPFEGRAQKLGRKWGEMWWGMNRLGRAIFYILGGLLLLMIISPFLPESTNSNGISSSWVGEFRWTNKNENDPFIHGYENESGCQQITEPNLYVHDGVKVKILGDSGFCYKVHFLGGYYKGERGWLLGRNLRAQPNPVQEAVVKIKERMYVWTNEGWTMPGHDRPCLWETYDKCIEADEIPNREIANNVPVKVLGTPSGTELAEYECVKIRPLTGKFSGEIFYIGVTHLVD